MRTPLRLDDAALFATKFGFLRIGFCAAEVELTVGGLCPFPFSVLFEYFTLSLDVPLALSGTRILVVLWDDGSLGGTLFVRLDFLRIGGSGFIRSFFGDELLWYCWFSVTLLLFVEAIYGSTYQSKSKLVACSQIRTFKDRGWSAI